MNNKLIFLSAFNDGMNRGKKSCATRKFLLQNKEELS